jgi:hypothetical protein
MPLPVMGARRCSSKIHNFLIVKNLQTDYLGDSESHGTCEHDCLSRGFRVTQEGSDSLDNGSTAARELGRHA